jgi:AcrR family transcriptional regulator
MASSRPVDSRVEDSRAKGKELPDGRGAKTRARLVAATVDEVAASGSFTAERVAHRAGTSPATFYVHLPSKDVALAAAFSQVLDELNHEVEAGLRIELLLDDGLARLCEAFVASAVQFFTDRSRVFRCALARLPESRELRRIYRDHEESALAATLRFVERGQAAGRVRAGDARVIATSTLVLCQGLNNPLLRGQRSGPLLLEQARALELHLAPDFRAGE